MIFEKILFEPYNDLDVGIVLNYILCFLRNCIFIHINREIIQ